MRKEEFYFESSDHKSRIHHRRRPPGSWEAVGENAFGYFCEQDPATVVVRDVRRLKKMTEQIILLCLILGHSRGSFILRNYLCKYGDGVESVRKIMESLEKAGLD